MKQCPGCYKKGDGRFCIKCRKLLFDGLDIPTTLPFEAPTPANFASYQEQTKRLSISGVQLKYALKLAGKKLVLTDAGSTYILKPLPPAHQLAHTDQAAENEHLTMQIAAQVFRIPTAANALLFFKDGAPAYLTRRFDITAPDGLRIQQEDFAQLSGKTSHTDGAHYKYHGTYESIGALIKKFVAASVPALEAFFKLVVFNYLFSNGDAHLKNFSIQRTAYGDYILTPAYDLMCTVLHTPQESDTALDLYPDDIKHPFYETYGYYGRPHFEELARRIGLLPRRANLIIDEILSSKETVTAMVANSFLNTAVKDVYLHYYLDKHKRFDANSNFK